MSGCAAVRAGAVALAAHVLLIGAGRSVDAQPTPTFRAETALVRLDVLATSRGRPIAGLGIDDFEVRDNGVVQRITTVTHTDTLHAVLVLDTSFSVAGRRIERLRAACAALVAKLRPDDRVTLVTFADRATPLLVDQPPGPAVAHALQRVEPKGGTAMLDAIALALRLVRSSSRPTFVMLLTDGVDTSSWTAPAGALRALQRVDAVFYGIAILPRSGRDDRGEAGYLRAETWWQPRPRDARALLQALTRTSGGRFVDSPREATLNGLFTRIVDEYRQRYIVTFVPGDPDREGWHTVNVRLTRRRGDVTARDGYWAGTR